MGQVCSAETPTRISRRKHRIVPASTNSGADDDEVGLYRAGLVRGKTTPPSSKLGDGSPKTGPRGSANAGQSQRPSGNNLTVPDPLTLPSNAKRKSKQSQYAAINSTGLLVQVGTRASSSSSNGNSPRAGSYAPAVESPVNEKSPSSTAVESTVPVSPPAAQLPQLQQLPPSILREPSISTSQANTDGQLAAATLQFESLTSEHQEQLLDFGIFPPGISVPYCTLVTYFTCRDAKAAISESSLRDLLQTLESKQLITKNADNRYLLTPECHQLVMHRIQTIDTNSSDGLPARHATLVNAYRRTLSQTVNNSGSNASNSSNSNGQTSSSSAGSSDSGQTSTNTNWLALQDDGYIVCALAHHMMKGGLCQEARRELCLNMGWLQRRAQSGCLQRLKNEITTLQKQGGANGEGLAYLANAIDATEYSEVKHVTADTLPKYLCDRLKNYLEHVPDIAALLKDQPYIAPEPQPEPVQPKQPPRGRGRRMNDNMGGSRNANGDMKGSSGPSSPTRGLSARPSMFADKSGSHSRSGTPTLPQLQGPPGVFEIPPNLNLPTPRSD